MFKIAIDILIGVILPFVVLIKPITEAKKDKKTVKQFLKDNKIEIILVFVLILGSLVRIVGIDKLPNALNVDETSSGYDSFSIMKYGIDRAGNQFPIYLYAWGSGQSALYSYIMMPFIAIGGLSVYTMRLPMALIGVASLYMIYYLLKNIFDNKELGLIGAAFFAICPWHIMKSRWGMECNIFPDLILLGTLLLVLGIKYKKNIWQILSFVVFGISSYSYGTSYLFLPLYVVGILIYLICKKEISIKRAVVYLAIVFGISLPMILYIIVNTFGLSNINIGITIPALEEVRYKDVTSIFGGNIISDGIQNIKSLIKLLVFQYDDYDWNAFSEFGMFYHISIIALVMGVVIAIAKYRHNRFNQIMGIWMIASLILGAFVDSNINRMNIIIIPCVYYIILGLYFIMKQHKVLYVAIIAIYALFFILFMIEYCTFDSHNTWTFAADMEEVVNYCTNSDAERVYCVLENNEPYIYFLFFDKYDVHKYIDTVQFKHEEFTFGNVKSFDRYNFYAPEEMEENSILVLPKGYKATYDDIEAKNTVELDRYVIYEY